MFVMTWLDLAMYKIWRNFVAQHVRISPTFKPRTASIPNEAVQQQQQQHLLPEKYVSLIGKVSSDFTRLRC